MIIDNNKVVTLNYKLQRDNEEGELVEETFGGQPLVFLYGVGQMIPEFEKQLTGKQAGDDLAFGIKSVDAYGEHNPDAIVSVPKEALGIENQEEAAEVLQLGRVLPLQDQEGRQFTGVITGLDLETVTLDLNHPMAGIDLFFTVKVEEVRAATESEVEHGHVHGQGGHHH